MNAILSEATHQTTVEDCECPRPDGTTMLVRVAHPRGPGPFPAVIDVHGGGWVMGDRKQNAVIDDTLAARGIVAAAPEFRMPPEGRYPTSIADVNLATRWLKANAGRFNSRRELVGGLGTSSGAHQLLLSVLRPGDPCYAALALTQDNKVDASLAYTVACWPVADPLRRFHMARERQIKNLLDAHAAYWSGEAEMDDGNPQRIVERGEFTSLPPLLVIQGTRDDNLPADMATRFVSAYVKAGGRAMLKEFADQPHTFITRDPASAASRQALAEIVDFIKARAATL
jgi:acetyl esterase/lipase